MLLTATRSSQKEEISCSGIPRISAEIVAFWKNLLATFPVFELPPFCGSGKKALIPILSLNLAWKSLETMSSASQADARTPLDLVGACSGWVVHGFPCLVHAELAAWSLTAAFQKDSKTLEDNVQIMQENVQF